MSDPQRERQVLQQLLGLSHELGEPGGDYVILGEGNTSARIDGESFWVKASGTRLATMGEGDFVQVSFARLREMVGSVELDDGAIREALLAARVDPGATQHPSVETLLHALCLELPGVGFVGHSHPTAINAVTCSTAFPSAFERRLFPDEIVVCGPAPLLIPYVDPGLPLARYIRDGLATHQEDHGEPPRLILMQNHGLVALGKSPRQVLDITAMAVKAARVLLGTHQMGGPRYMTAADVERIHVRPDEAYRRRILDGEAQPRSHDKN